MSMKSIQLCCQRTLRSIYIHWCHMTRISTQCYKRCNTSTVYRSVWCHVPCIAAAVATYCFLLCYCRCFHGEIMWQSLYAWWQFVLVWIPYSTLSHSITTIAIVNKTLHMYCIGFMPLRYTCSHSSITVHVLLNWYSMQGTNCHNTFAVGALCSEVCVCMNTVHCIKRSWPSYCRV